MATYSYPEDFEGTFWTVVDGDFYVSTIGSDTNGNGSPASPYLTIDKALELAGDKDKIVIGPDEYVTIVESDQAGSAFQEFTYEELRILKSANNMVPGTMYKISDHATKHQIPGTSEINTGLVEPLIVKAISENILDSKAYSPAFPDDIVLYDFDNDLCEDGITARTGKITYRKDTKKILSSYYDWRNVKFRRYNITGITHGSVTETTPSAFEATIINGAVDTTATRYREYYLQFPVTHGAAPSLSLTKGANTVTKPLQKTGGVDLAANELSTYLTNGLALVYYSPHYDSYIAVNSSGENAAVQGLHSWVENDFSIGNSTPLSVDSGTFQDFFTFGNVSDGGSLFEVQIGKWGDNYNNIIFSSDSVNVRNVQISNNTYNMTFSHSVTRSIDMGEDSYNNLVLNDLSWSKIDNEYYNNIMVRFLRHFDTNGESYSNSYLGTGNFYYMKFYSLCHNTTFRLTHGGFSGQAFFNGILTFSHLNLSNMRRSVWNGEMSNKSFEHGLDWARHIWDRSSSTVIEHFAENRNDKYEIDVPLRLDLDLSEGTDFQFLVRDNTSKMVETFEPPTIAGATNQETLSNILSALQGLGLLVDNTAITGQPSGDILKVDITLSNSQILNLGTELELIPAPGANKVIDFVGLSGSIIGDAAYNGNPSLIFYLGDENNAVCSSIPISSIEPVYIRRTPEDMFVVAQSPFIDRPIYVRTSDAQNPSGGNTSLKLSIYYTIFSMS
ncbi:MAG: hypothetical protein AAFX87_19790 [Bacteroidota bacterium]